VKAGNKASSATVPQVTLTTEAAVVAPTLAEAQATQSAALNAACQAAIGTGFSSSALGAPYTYPMQQTDQLNLGRALNVANMVINAPPWAAGGTHKAGEVITAASQVFICVEAGVSSRNEQNWSIPVGTVTEDGTCKWRIWTTPLWCCSSSGEWVYLAHTAPQIRQLGMDEQHFISSLQLQNAGLQAQVKAATTVAEVQDTTWPSA